MKIRDFQDGTFSVGQVVGVVSARVEGGRTTPPERYSEQLLLEDMTSAHKFAADPNDRAVLSEISGLGTSRTRAAIISNLVDRELLVKQQVSGRAGKKKAVIVSSPHARAIVKLLPPALTSVATTAKWELGFRLVEEGAATPQQMQAHLDRALAGIVDDARRHLGTGVGAQMQQVRGSATAAAPTASPQQRVSLPSSTLARKFGAQSAA